MQKLFKNCSLILMLILSISLVSCSKNNQNSTSKKTMKIDEDRIITLLNYIHYSTCKIINSNNRMLAEKEHAEIRDIIKPETLINDEIIEQYQTLLDELSTLKILSEKKKMVQEINELKRKNAIYDSLQGTLFIPSGDPVSMGISIAFTAVSAGFNYARAINDIDIEEKKENFEIWENEQTSLDRLSSSLFTTSAKVLKGKDNINTLIIPSEMKEFARIAALIETCPEINLKKVCSENLPILKNMESKFSLFAPYWLTIGIAYFNNENYSEAEKCLNNVIQISNSNSVLKNNPYIVDASKFLILIKLNEINSDFSNLYSVSQEIEMYLEYIKQNTIVTESTQDDLNYFLFSTNIIIGKYNEAKENLDYLFQRGIENEYGRLACYYYIKRNEIYTLEYKRSVLLDSSLHHYDFGPDLNNYVDKDVAKKLGSKIGNKSVYFITTKNVSSSRSYFDGSSFKNLSIISEKLNDIINLYYFPEITWDDLDKNRIDLFYNDGTGLSFKFNKDKDPSVPLNQDYETYGTFKSSFLKKDKPMIVITEGVYTDPDTYSWIDIDSKTWGINN